MKRIIVQSVLKDIFNSGKIAKKRSEMINNAPNSPLKSIYPANELADKMHPHYFNLRVSSCKESGDIIIVELVPENESTVFYFREGQMLTVKFSSSESKNSFSVPIMSPSGLNKITVGVSTISKAYELFKNSTGKNLIGVSIEGSFFYNSVRDKQNICFLTDIHGLPSVYGITNSLNKALVKIFFFGSSKNSFPELELEAVSAVPDTKILEKYSIYVCGSYEFCEKMKNEISNRDIIPVNLRFLNLGSEEEYPPSKTIHKCTVICKDSIYEIKCYENEKLLYALENSDVQIKARCINGECGYCRSRLISGNVKLLANALDHRTAADVKYGYIHPCTVTPISDITIEI